MITEHDRKDIPLFTDPPYVGPSELIDESQTSRPRIMQLTPDIFSKTVVGDTDVFALTREWVTLNRLSDAGLSADGVVPYPLMLKQLPPEAYPTVGVSLWNSVSVWSFPPLSGGTSIATSRLDGTSVEQLSGNTEQKAELYPHISQIIRGALYAVSRIHDQDVLLTDFNRGNMLLTRVPRDTQRMRVQFVDFEHTISKEEFDSSTENQSRVINRFYDEGHILTKDNISWDTLQFAQKAHVLREIVEFFISDTHPNTFDHSQYHPNFFYFQKPESIDWNSYYPPGFPYGRLQVDRRKELAMKHKQKAQKLGYWPSITHAEGKIHSAFMVIPKSTRIKISQLTERYDTCIKSILGRINGELGSDGDYANQKVRDYMMRRNQRIWGIPTLAYTAPYILREVCGVEIDTDVKKMLTHYLHPDMVSDFRK